MLLSSLFDINSWNLIEMLNKGYRRALKNEACGYSLPAAC